MTEHDKNKMHRFSNTYECVMMQNYVAKIQTKSFILKLRRKELYLL